MEPDPQIESWGVTVRKSLGLPLFGPAQSPARAAVAALDRNVFGAPSYVIDDEIFWGQDRLGFVERRLALG